VNFRTVAESWEIFPIWGAEPFAQQPPWQHEPRISAIPAIWHAPCKAARIGNRAAWKPKGENEMTTFSNYAQHVLAGLSAFAISALLFANTLATKAVEVQSVAGILA